MNSFCLALGYAIGLAVNIAIASESVPAPRSVQDSDPIQPGTSAAFVNVNVVPMDSERILERQTVVVRNGRIAEIGAADKVVVPENVQRIDGRGKFLMPGLTDMHVHLKSPREFELYLANGVTTVFNLWGRPAHLEWRDSIAKGQTRGPTIYTCGPIIFHADTADEARRIVEEQSKAGYDSIKIYNDVSKEAYPVLVETARQRHMLVVGHIPRAVGLEGVLKANQAVAHLEEYIYTFFKDDVNDTSRIPEAVAATRAADVPVTLTLVNFDHILRQADDLPAFLSRPEIKYLAPWVRDSWSPGRNFYAPRFKNPQSREYLRKALAFQKTLTRELNRAGVKLLAGTDAMNPGVVPGFSLHEELQYMVESGLTPFEAIRSATRYPAEFLDPAADFGTVAIGKRADLVLLNGNPLQSIANLTRCAGVMARGNWLSATQLRNMLDEVGPHYAAEHNLVIDQLEHNPEAAFQHFATDDPFNTLAIASVGDMIIKNGFGWFKKIYTRVKRDQPDAILAQDWFLNDVSVDLMDRDRKSDAIAMLQLNTELYPQSASAFNNIAEEYMKKGQKDLAIRYYRKALEMDTNFTSSIEALKKLAP
jgi:tetratricopeptide (TPR) repeat protein